MEGENSVWWAAVLATADRSDDGSHQVVVLARLNPMGIGFDSSGRREPRAMAWRYRSIALKESIIAWSEISDADGIR